MRRAQLASKSGSGPIDPQEGAEHGERFLLGGVANRAVRDNKAYVDGRTEPAR